MKLLTIDTWHLQRPEPRVVAARPIPESNFISSVQARMSAPETSSSTPRQGELAQKLLAMQQEKNRAIEDRKIAVLEAKYTAEVKRAEENAKRKLEQEKRKAELAEEKARVAAQNREKKRYDAELNRKARMETRKIISEAKKELAEEKKKKLDEQKKKAAEERAAKRARFSEAQRLNEEIAPLQLGDDVVQVPVMEAPQLRKKVNMFDELR
jgi:membrane protein involved in colicin uptake